MAQNAADHEMLATVIGKSFRLPQVNIAMPYCEVKEWTHSACLESVKMAISYCRSIVMIQFKVPALWQTNGTGSCISAR